VEDKKSHNVSETGSVSVLRWMVQDKPTQLGPLERASLNQSSALYLPGKFLVLISDRGCVEPRAIVQLEGLGKLKNPMTSLGLEPVTFWLVA
jgi:hypothetical protein